MMNTVFVSPSTRDVLGWQAGEDVESSSSPSWIKEGRMDGRREEGMDGWKEAKGVNRKAGEPMIKGAKQQSKKSMNQIDADEDEKFTGGDTKKQSGNRLISGHTK